MLRGYRLQDIGFARLSMAFHFHFDTLYRLRQSLEHQQELRLRAANQQVAKVRHAIEQLHEQMRQLQVHSSEQFSVGTTVAEIRFTLNTVTAFATRYKDLQRLLLQASKVRDQQESIFRQARRQCETLEILRDQQLKEYQRAQNRRQQRILDELILMRHTCQKRA